MATLDDILHGQDDAPKGSKEWAANNTNKTDAVKGSKEWSEQQSAGNVTGPVVPTVPIKQSTPSTTLQGAQQTLQPITQQMHGKEKEGGLAWLYRQLNPYKEPTAEELEKERKKQKREEIFAAIGDGISALSNLYFTTQDAPSMYSGKNTMSERTKVRYDKLLKEREDNRTAYINGYLKARQADEADAKEQQAWKRQLQLDEERRQKQREDVAWREKQAEIEQKRYDDAQAENRRRFDIQQTQAEKSHNFRVKQHEDNMALYETKKAEKMRGKELFFTDGKGNKVRVYENAWRPSMQQVYDVMLADLAPADEAERKRWERQMKKLDTAQKKEDFVKQNWHKSQRARDLMLALSKYDPGTTQNNVVGDGEDWSQYEVSGEEDYNQYEVK